MASPLLRNWEFQLPTRVAFGRGGVRKLGAAVQALGRTALVVGYRDCPALAEAYAKLAAALRAAGVAATEFLAVHGEPEAQLVADGAAAARAGGCEVVVGIGGGSVIDAAKGIALVARSGGALGDYADANPQRRAADEALPVVALPTTAGTGAEVTDVAVFRRAAEADRPAAKISITAAALRPKAAIIDPDLAAANPPRLVAACGIDAFAHAVEASMSRAANPLSRLLAREAASLIFRNLPAAVAWPQDAQPRDALALAAMLAGMAFQQSGVTLAHSVAHALGALMDMPHAEAVAVAMPLGLRFNAEACADVYAELAAACGTTEDFPAAVATLLRSVGLAERIPFPQNAPSDLPARLAENAFATTPQPLRLNPRKIDQAMLASLLEQELAAAE